MKPRTLRHRLEKAAKLLVLIQKHVPEVSCQWDEARSDHGVLILDFTDSGMSRTKLRQLGEDLEARGYQFTHSKSPWLGQETYSCKAPDKTQIVLSLPIVKNRLSVDQGTTQTPYQFKPQ